MEFANIFLRGVIFLYTLTRSGLIVDTVTDTVTDTVNQLLENKFSIAVIGRLHKIISVIYKTPGLKSNTIAMTLNIDESNIRRDIKKLQEPNLIVFKGPPKTGGYFIKDELQGIPND